jgi:hypothetical protein
MKTAALNELIRKWEREAEPPENEVRATSEEELKHNAVETGTRIGKHQCAEDLKNLILLLGYNQ